MMNLHLDHVILNEIYLLLLNSLMAGFLLNVTMISNADEIDYDIKSQKADFKSDRPTVTQAPYSTRDGGAPKIVQLRFVLKMLMFVNFLEITH